MGDTIKIKLNTIEDVKKFSQLCESIENIDIDYIIGRYVIDAKSIMGILSTTLGKVASVKIHTSNQNILNSFFNSINKWIAEEYI